MNKRQRKKKQKKYLPVIADEANLLRMSEEERKVAMEQYKRFRERYAYKKRYKDLRRGMENSLLVYTFPMGEKVTTFLKEVSSVSRRFCSNGETVVTQSIEDFKGWKE